jgi:hypothetical protein
LRGAVERVGALRCRVTDEAWRFTGISALAQQPFHPAGRRLPCSPRTSSAFASTKQRSGCSPMASMRRDSPASAPPAAGAGVVIGNLATPSRCG